MDTSWTLGHARFAKWVKSLASQQAAADLIACSQANVSFTLRGSMPRMEMLARIRDASSAWDEGAITLESWTVPTEREVVDHDAPPADRTGTAA